MNTLYIAGIICQLSSFTGVSYAQCDPTGYPKCLAGVQLPQGETTRDVNCTALRQVASCLEPFKSSCASNTDFQSILQTINITCGDSSCDLITCLTDMGIDFGSLQSDPEKVNCESFRAAQPCVESQKNVCEGNTIFEIAAGYIPQLESRCGRGGSQGNGSFTIQAAWILLFVVLVNMAALSQ
ncbi:uncharacterized protein LOC133177194 isoform X2 [Saccostrea echinata]|uniref:uncharacterized protein LOC133177194 isoform X2 n=1 Tax=Saccostrea echinata TaxID=191078 RepID=UPI002A820CAC|nr:uncharacterized protein LOC133177194 isoform X2 [Saccostrea echinata]